jgi:polar amino acid transport system permease protein
MQLDTVILHHFNELIAGAGMTVLVSLSAIALGLPLGFLVCFSSISKNTGVRSLAGVYVSFLRGTPILVLLLIVFYVLPAVGIEAPPLIAAIAALSLNTAAFQSEIYRGGLNTIHAGQIEAARAIGMSVWQTRLRILIPQVLRLVLPALLNEIIVILKNSSLVSVIAVTELMRVSQQIVSKTYRPAEIYVATALLYLVMNLVLSGAGTIFHNRLGKYAETS